MNISASPLFYLLKERKKKVRPSSSSGDLTQEKEAEHSDIPLTGNLSAIISSSIFLPAPLDCMYPKNRLLQPAAPISEELAIVGGGIAQHPTIWQQEVTTQSTLEILTGVTLLFHKVQLEQVWRMAVKMIRELM